MRLDLEVQFDSSIEEVWGAVELKRQGTMPNQGIEMPEGFCAKAPGQAITGQGEDLLQRSQAHSGKSGRHVSWQAEALYR